MRRKTKRMKARTKALYDEWSRLDAMLSRGAGNKTLAARKARVGAAIARARVLEMR
jgi:hypothetical protein